MSLDTMHFIETSDDNETSEKYEAEVPIYHNDKLSQSSAESESDYSDDETDSDWSSDEGYSTLDE
jgi:hypothetical protein